jgi:aspartyl-tRNA(Asn)/glutamyl-tRNA(Gln) amidotransferase subunit C
MEIRDVEKLAELARIDLTEEEKQGLLKDFDSILAYVDAIKSVKVDETKGGESLYNSWREDEPAVRDFSLDIITEQFPDAKDGFLKVKKIL